MLTRIPWSAEIDAQLTDPAGAACVPYLRAEVQRGVACLYRFEHAGERGYLITRLDTNPTELVLCYAQGRGVAKVLPGLIAGARDAGIPVRVHTSQQAIVRLLRRYGLQLAEMVLRCH